VFGNFFEIEHWLSFRFQAGKQTGFACAGFSVD
jgi:hypothetical protein